MLGDNVAAVFSSTASYTTPSSLCCRVCLRIHEHQQRINKSEPTATKPFVKVPQVALRISRILPTASSFATVTRIAGFQVDRAFDASDGCAVTRLSAFRLAHNGPAHSGGEFDLNCYWPVQDDR